MISQKDVLHIARLARIELTLDELAAFERELSAILDFVAKLGQADTEGAGEEAGGTTLENVMREDGLSLPRNTEVGPDLVRAAPARRGDSVEVREVFEQR